MKKHHLALICLLVAGIAVFLVGKISNTAEAQATATLTLSPTSASVAVNQTFTVNVNLNTAGAPVDGVDIYMLRFNPTVLQVVDSNGGVAGIQIAPGALMSNTAINTVDNSAGTIQFSQSTSGGSSFTGSGVLATITFRGNAGGSSTVNFDFSVGSTSDTNAAYQGVDRLSSVTNANFTVDATAPTAPSGLAANVISSTQINLTWNASSDAVGVTGYQVERCTGAACASFAQIATPVATNHNDTGLTSGTVYRYRVRATDAAGNLSSYSSTVNGTTTSAFDFSISNGGNRSVTQGSSVTNSVTTTLSAGGTQSVSFGASGMPSGVTASFGPASCSPTCTSTLTLTASGIATLGNAVITVTGTAGALNKTTTFTLTVNSGTFQRTISISSLEGLTSRNVSGSLVAMNLSRVVLKTFPFATDAAGNATITFDITAQPVLLQIRVAPFLSRLISQDLSVNTVYSFSQLLTGDINQDNIINSIDYSQLNTNWFTSNAATDLNKDGLVNSIDYSYMNKNWLVTGEQ
jgi:hypothetical protein